MRLQLFTAFPFKERLCNVLRKWLKCLFEQHNVQPMGAIRFKLDVAKATQAAAFVTKLAGGNITRSKLIKALYFADRKQFLRIGKPITGDQPCSMEHGPVLSGVYDFIKGDTANPTWHGALVTDGPFDVVLLKDPGTDLLTEKECDLLRESFERIRNKDFRALRAYCHDPKVCPELEEVEGTSRAIPFERILEKFGKSAEQIEGIQSQLEEEKFLAKVLG